jgi:hypothetical protein
MAASFVAVVGICLPAGLRAEVRRLDVQELATLSDLIVVARVTKVEDGRSSVTFPDGRRAAVKVATAHVIEIWKGEKVSELRFLASPTLACDIADAEEGELVVLFLERQKTSSVKAIAHAGRGRMPIREVKGKSYATIWSDDVLLPEGTVTIPGPEPKSSFIRSIELSKLKELVRENKR